ncbi:hypothetical protein FWF48_02545 [Candidatus Saccharibacteria bacterium]|nr:hypothetical protein [Candidatus Saccharibacteria bacterium]
MLKTVKLIIKKSYKIRFVLAPVIALVLIACAATDSFALVADTSYVKGVITSNSSSSGIITINTRFDLINGSTQCVENASGQHVAGPNTGYTIKSASFTINKKTTTDNTNFKTGTSVNHKYSISQTLPAGTFNISWTFTRNHTCGVNQDSVVSGTASVITIPKQWTISASTTMNKTNNATVNVGDTVTWTHTITNDGPDATDKAVTSSIVKTNLPSSLSTQSASTASGKAKGTIRTITSSYTVATADAGKKLCESATASPKAWNSTSTAAASSTALCVNVAASAANWSYSGRSQVKTGTVDTIGSVAYGTSIVRTRPTWLVYYQHDMSASGTAAGATNRPNTTYSVWRATSTTTNYPNDTRLKADTAWGAGANSTGWSSAGTWGWNNTSAGTVTTDTITQAQVNTTRCQYITWSQSAYNNSGRSYSPLACATVPYNYDTAPAASIDSDGALEPGESVNGKGSLKVLAVDPATYGGVVGTPANYATNTKASEWQLVAFTAPNKASVPLMNQDVTKSTADPCTAAVYGTNCQKIAGNTGQVFAYNFDSNVDNALGSYKVPTDLAVGAQVCFAMSIKQANSKDADYWNHSKPACVTVGKKPKVQVMGGGIGARGRIDTSQTTKSNTLFGSWTEYEAVSLGSISKLATGNGFADPNAVTRALAYNKLTFSNDKTTFGNFDTMGSNQLGAVIANYSKISGTEVNDNQITLTGNSQNYIAKNDVRITAAAEIEQGSTVIIYATNNVTIGSNIQYTSGPVTTSTIPQVLIVAKGDIKIEPGVTRIDAWLVSEKNIYTCNGVTASTLLTIDNCNQQLVINGPVMSGGLNMWRTYGSSDTDAAEIFNLRPETYIWAYDQAARGNNKAITTAIRELPPRY